MLKQVIDLFELLDDPAVTGQTVVDFFASKGYADTMETRTIPGETGSADFIRIIVRGTDGVSAGGNAPTLGITGQLGGIGARPVQIGFVSDGDGALAALTAAYKLCEMKKKGDSLPGDVVISTQICPHAPTTPHFPTPFMSAHVAPDDLRAAEKEVPVDALLCIDTTKGNKIICHQGFAISCPVKEGYILKASDDLVEIMSRVTGQPAYVFPLSTQDITPYGNDLYHMNSILQPSTATSAPTVGVAITTVSPVAGCATGATHLTDVEQTARFAVEVAKDFTRGMCSFYDVDEFAMLIEKYGEMTRFQRRHI